MDDQWGPWIEHDGAEPQHVREGDVVLVQTIGGYLRDDGPISFETPNWYWRRRPVRVGLFRRELRPVCDDPAYAPILRYRIKRPRGLIEIRGMLADMDLRPQVPA